MKYKILERISKLEKDIAILTEIIKNSPDRRLEDRLKDAHSSLSTNLTMYKILTGETYIVKIAGSIAGIEKTFRVRKGANFINGRPSRELYIDGMLYKNWLTPTAAKLLIEALA